MSLILTRAPHRSPIVALLAGLAIQPVPPPTRQVTADCVTPTYASDQLVCTDTELREVDQRYRAELEARGEVRLEPDAIWEGDVEWLRRRSQCAFRADHRDCLLAAYADRRSLLAAIGATNAPLEPVDCREDGVTLRRHLLRTADGSVVLRGDDGVSAVASPAERARNGWTSFTTVKATQAGFGIRSLGGRVLECAGPQ